MKGMHLTIDSWQVNRAEDGFKMTAKELQAFENSKWANTGLPCRRSDKEEDGGTPTPRAPDKECAPVMVEPVERYPRDLECLIKLTSTSSWCSFWWGTQAAKGKATPSLSSTGWITNWGLESRVAREVFKLQGGREFDRSTGEVGGQWVVAQPQGLFDHRQLLLQSGVLQGAFFIKTAV